MSYNTFRFSDEQYIAILKAFYTHDSRLNALSTTLLQNALIKSEQTQSIKPLEKWARAWKKCRLNIKKTYHKYGLLRAGDKKDIEQLFNLYLSDKEVAKLFSTTPPNILQMITDVMVPHPVKLTIKHPTRGCAERIASRLSAGFERIASHEGHIRIRNKD